MNQLNHLAAARLAAKRCRAAATEVLAARKRMGGGDRMQSRAAMRRQNYFARMFRVYRDEALRALRLSRLAAEKPSDLEARPMHLAASELNSFGRCLEHAGMRVH